MTAMAAAVVQGVCESGGSKELPSCGPPRRGVAEVPGIKATEGLGNGGRWIWERVWGGRIRV